MTYSSRPGENAAAAEKAVAAGNEACGAVLRSADVVLVGDATDVLLTKVQEECRRRNVRAVRVENDAFGQQLSIRVSGSSVSVTPDLPLLLRRQKGDSESSAADVGAALLRSALLRSACALSTAPVINRPVPGVPLHPASRFLIAELRSGSGIDPGLLLEEGFTNEGRPDPDRCEAEALTDMQDESAPFAQSFRYRPRLPEGWIHQKVLVVGERAWIFHDTLRNSAAVRTLSVEVARALGLALCCIYWRTTGRADGLRLARVSSHPTGSEMGDKAAVAASAVADLLLP